MKHTRTVQKTVEETDYVACDKCEAKEYKKENWDKTEDEVIEFKHHFGFFAKDLDQAKIEFDLCSECLIKILKEADVKYRLRRLDDPLSD